MDVAALFVFAAALFVAAVSPGPGVAAILARVLGRGAGRSVVFTAGLAFGDVVWLAAAVGGLAVLAQNFQMVFLAVKWIGVAYLLYLAWKMWTSPPTPQVVAAATHAERPVLMFLAGLAVTLGNPKTMVFYLALLPNLIDVEAVTLVGFLELAAIVLIVLGIVFGGYIVLAEKARSLLTSSGSVKLVNRISAGAMAGAASWVATR
jgi:threonine/homoserine/homoserine lactone efflux protein